MIILIIILLMSIFVNINLYKKITKIELEYYNEINEYVNLYKTIYSLFFATYSRLLKIDKKKAVYTDPEVNFVYKNMVEIIDKIRLFLLKNTSEEILEGNLGNDKN